QTGRAAPPATEPIGGQRRTTDPNFSQRPTGAAYQPPQPVMPRAPSAPAAVSARRGGSGALWVLLSLFLVLFGGVVICGAYLVAHRANRANVRRVTPPKPPGPPA